MYRYRTATPSGTDVSFNITCHTRYGEIDSEWGGQKGKRGRLAGRKLSHSRLYIKKLKSRQIFREENHFFLAGTDKQTLTYISQEKLEDDLRLDF
jgi:hypothetical protein